MEQFSNLAITIRNTTNNTAKTYNNTANNTKPDKSGFFVYVSMWACELMSKQQAEFVSHQESLNPLLFLAIGQF